VTAKTRNAILAIAALTLITILMLWGEPWNLDLPFHRYQPKASNGVLDLRKYDFQAGGILKLNGDWEFYWSALLSPSDLESGLGTMSGYISPRFWNGYPVDGRNSSDGMAGHAAHLPITRRVTA